MIFKNIVGIVLFVMFVLVVEQQVFQFLDMDNEDPLDAYIMAIRFSSYIAWASGVLLFIQLDKVGNWIVKAFTSKKPSVKKSKKPEDDKFISKVDLFDHKAIKKAYQAGLETIKGESYYQTMSNAKDKGLAIKIFCNDWWQQNKGKYRPTYKGNSGV